MNPPSRTNAFDIHSFAQSDSIDDLFPVYTEAYLQNRIQAASEAALNHDSLSDPLLQSAFASASDRSFVLTHLSESEKKSENSSFTSSSITTHTEVSAISGQVSLGLDISMPEFTHQELHAAVNAAKAEVTRSMHKEQAQSELHLRTQIKELREVIVTFTNKYDRVKSQVENHLALRSQNKKLKAINHIQSFIMQFWDWKKRYEARCSLIQEQQKKDFHSLNIKIRALEEDQKERTKNLERLTGMLKAAAASD